MMDHGIDVRVNNVDNSEIDYLTTIVDAIKSEDFGNALISSDRGKTDYIVTIRKCELDRLKEALRLILQVVKPERIEIDT